ncbi:tyrosine-type recombinase/integrase [Devosia sp.]|uniref:tyrosine-type recombinase/integrase n=1 Tax=Devosia sp. TaxID=1871048 RepID=UPI002613444F|nr:tyrosine-type recombinase/integrase [Devosia sp.]
MTAAGIDGLRPKLDPFLVRDARTTGLGVRVATSGIKSWDLSFRIKGKPNSKRLSLGFVTDVSLQDARSRARVLVAAARAGRDLLLEEATARREEENRITVADLVERYVSRRVKGRLRTALEIERRLYRALTPVLQWKLEKLTRRDIRQLLDPVADAGWLREAEKRRQGIGAMLNWAVAQDYLEINPSAGLQSYGNGEPRTRTLTDDEISALWNWLSVPDQRSSSATILKIQLLLGARCSEVAGITVGEIDQHTWIWTLPASRSKNGRARETPLVGQVRRLLEEQLSLVRTSAIFATSGGVTMTARDVGSYLLNRSKRLPVPKFATHDLRRTVATRLVELGHSIDLIAALFGHQSGSSATSTLFRHYVHTQQLDQKADLLASWDAHVLKLSQGN